MLTFEQFSGINNVAPQERLGKGALAAATNVDIGPTREISRREGYTLLDPECHRNLWQGNGYLLATIGTGELVAVKGGVETSLHPALGPDRVWYADLPGPSTLFSNGLLNGVTDGVTWAPLGVRSPASAGSFVSVPGQLDPGTYQWWTTAVRTSDGLESGTTYGGAAVADEGGALITGLPVVAGHTTSVYLSSANGDAPFFAGNTAGPAFSFTGKNDTLVLPCRTQFMVEMPVGTLCAFWRGRVLVASGNQLLASRPHQWGLHDPRRDFKQFSAPITLIQPVDDGIYIGTEQELAFLSGGEFDKLMFSQVMPGAVLKGSGVGVPGELIKRGDAVGAGSALVCVVARKLTACFDGGVVELMSEGRYLVDPAITEVVAAFRETRGTPQYIAVPV